MADTNNVNDSTAVTTELQELETLQTQLRSEHDMYLRSLADFDNYRRRTERDVASAIERGKRDLILAFLEVVDSFERALQQLGHASASLAEGLEATHRKALVILQAQGIAPYKSMGEAFDPALHEAVATVSGPQYTTATVVSEIQRGYRSGDVIVRPALVTVSR